MSSTCPLRLRIRRCERGGISLVATPTVRSGRPAWDLTLTSGADGFRGALSLVLSLPDGQEPWFLFPGFFLGNGRAADGQQRWPCLGPKEDPEQFASPWWDFALDRGAYPVLLAHDGSRWRGLDWSPHYDLDTEGSASTWGDSEPQVGCGLTWQDGQGELRLNIPADEGPRRHARNRHHGPTARTLELPPGTTIRLTVGCWDRPGARAGSGAILHQVRQELAPSHPAADLPLDAVLADAACHGLLAWHWIDDPGYFVYTAAYDRSAEFNANNKRMTLGWHFEALGFVGGFPVAFGLLWHALRSGHDQARTVAERCLTRWCRDGATEWGFFRTSYHPGKARTANGAFANPAGTGAANQDPSGDTPFYGSCWLGGGQRLVHARTTADASLYLARCLDLLGSGHNQHGSWRAVLRRSLEAALEVQDAQGRFGQHYDVVARTVARAEGSGGLLWIPALHHAHDLFADDPDFQARLRSALARAGDGYAPDVHGGWIVGAPEDVDLAPTSEDGYNAVMAYAALHRRFRDPRWLDLLRLSCDWTLAWRKAYNVRFPSRNVLGAFDFRTVGGDFASSHNNHLHVYGCNCLADFVHLARTVDEPSYAERAREHFAYTAQLLCTEDGQWNGQRGMAGEQFYSSDWSIWGEWDPTIHHVQKGTFMGFSHVWCINMILLGLEQVEQAGWSWN